MKTYIIGNLFNLGTFYYTDKTSAVLLEVQKCKIQPNIKIENSIYKTCNNLKCACYNIINIIACCEINDKNLSKILIHSKIREKNFNLKSLEESISFIMVPDVKNKNRDRVIFEAENDADAIKHFKDVISNLDPIKYIEYNKDKKAYAKNYKNFALYKPLIQFKKSKAIKIKDNHKYKEERLVCFGKNFELLDPSFEKIKIKKMLNDFYRYYSEDSTGINFYLNEFFNDPLYHNGNIFGINNTIFEKIQFYLAYSETTPETFILVNKILKKFVNESGYFKVPYKGLLLNRYIAIDVDSFIKNQLVSPIICIFKNDHPLIKNNDTYFYNNNLEEFLLDPSIFVLKGFSLNVSSERFKNTTFINWRITSATIKFAEIKNNKKCYIILDSYNIDKFTKYLNENLYIKSPINGKLLNIKKILIESEKTNGQTVY